MIIHSEQVDWDMNALLGQMLDDVTKGMLCKLPMSDDIAYMEPGITSLLGQCSQKYSACDKDRVLPICQD